MADRPRTGPRLALLGVGAAAAFQAARWCLHEAEAPARAVWSVRWWFAAVPAVVLVPVVVGRVAVELADRRAAAEAPAEPEPETAAPLTAPEPCPYGPTCPRCLGFAALGQPPAAAPEPVEVEPAPVVPMRRRFTRKRAALWERTTAPPTATG